MNKKNNIKDNIIDNYNIITISKNKKIKIGLFSLYVFASLFIYSNLNTAKAQVIYKRVNQNGVMVYSDYIPTNSKERYETYSSKNMSLRKITERELTQTEYASIDYQKKEEENIRKIVAEEKRKDEILLSTYNTISDIDRMKDFEIGQLNNSLANETEMLARLKDQNNILTENLVNAPENNRDSLQNNILRNQRDITSLENSISRSRSLVIEKEQKYKEDKERFTRILEERAKVAQEELNKNNEDNVNM